MVCSVQSRQENHCAARDCRVWAEMNLAAGSLHCSSRRFTSDQANDFCQRARPAVLIGCLFISICPKQKLTISLVICCRAFADSMQLPVIEENCPACFEAPKERVRCKQVVCCQSVVFSPTEYHYTTRHSRHEFSQFVNTDCSRKIPCKCTGLSEIYTEHRTVDFLISKANMNAPAILNPYPC